MLAGTLYGKRNEPLQFMTREQIEKKYNKIYKNFMTPEIIKWEIEGNRVLELSTGRGISNERIFGVTEFVVEDNELVSSARSTMFSIRKKAIEHYNYLLNN